jgi:hypothetical protein
LNEQPSRVYHAARRRGGVAARGERAADGGAVDTAMVLLQPLSLLAQVNLIFARSYAFGTASVISGMQGWKTRFAPTR